MNPNGLLLLDNKIYVSSASTLYTYILQYNHDHILVRYYGQNKILELVHHGYFWLSLCADVQQLCKSYVTCIWCKIQCHKPYRSLKQLHIPKQLWNFIFMDFIKNLLLFSGFDTILVIVDQLTKQVIFISAYNTITSVHSSYVLKIQYSVLCYFW